MIDTTCEKIWMVDRFSETEPELTIGDRVVFDKDGYIRRARSDEKAIGVLPPDTDFQAGMIHVPSWWVRGLSRGAI